MAVSAPMTVPASADIPGTLVPLHAYLVHELASLPQVVNRQEKAGVILEVVCDISPRDLLMSPQKEVSDASRRRIDEVLAKAREGLPLAYALGECFFAGRRFFVDSRVLIPRPDTEALYLAAKELVQLKTASDNSPIRVLEIGTGCGAVIISLAADFPHLEAVGTDISAPALAVAHTNAEDHRVNVDFVESNLFSAFDDEQRFDLVIANPPYVARGNELDADVLEYEPREALLVPPGKTGTYFHRLIAAQAGNYLKRGGWLLLEVGIGQAEEVAAILERVGFKDVHKVRDLCGIDRVVMGRW